MESKAGLMMGDLDEAIKQVPIEKVPLETSEVEISFEKTVYDPTSLSGSPLVEALTRQFPSPALSIQQRGILHKENKRMV